MDGIDTESATIAMDFGIDDSLCSIVVYDATLGNLDTGISGSNNSLWFEFYDGTLYCAPAAISMNLTPERLELCGKIINAKKEFNTEERR